MDTIVYRYSINKNPLENGILILNQRQYMNHEQNSSIEL